MKAVVIGTGMMGPGIALTLAMGGVETTLLSRSAESGERGVETAERQWELLRGHGLGKKPSRIGWSTEFEVVADADLVVESAPEEMGFKQELFARLDEATAPECVLASNTSGLSITAIAERCRHRGRVLTTHFWNPPHLMPLVEIVLGAETEAAVAEWMRALLEECGKTPVLVRKDTPGQLGNRLQMALVREAAHIVGEGIATAADVDLAARMGFGLRLPAYGVLEHQDVVGLPMGLAITEYVAGDLYNEPRAPEYYRDLVRDGKLGAKTGQGFHSWPEGKLEAVKARRDAFILTVLTNASSTPDQ
jgi:3-hydroxybutyryl-CoA dehydrogenase